jgi:hypothetical protein
MHMIILLESDSAASAVVVGGTEALTSAEYSALGINISLRRTIAVAPKKCS